MKTIASLLKYYRELRNYTMITLSEKAGISNSYYNEIEKGRKIPPFDTLNKIILALNLSDEQKSELIEITKNERFQHKVEAEKEKLSKMTYEEKDRSLDSLRKQLPGVEIIYEPPLSQEYKNMSEKEVNEKTDNLGVAFNAFNKLSLDEKKSLLQLFNIMLKDK